MYAADVALAVTAGTDVSLINRFVVPPSVDKKNRIIPAVVVPVA